MERKKFLKSLSLVGLSSGALLTACNTTSSTDTGSDSELTDDAALIQQAAEREAIAIQTYGAAASSGIITSQAVADTALLYQSHHQEHLVEFNDLLKEFGAYPIVLDDFSADERISDVSSQTEAVELAMTLEREAAQAYFTRLVNQLQQPNPRRSFGNIYPVEVSHFVTLKAALGRTPAVDNAFFDGIQAN